MRKWLLYLCFCSVLFCSCSSMKQVIVEKEYVTKTDTLIKYKNIHDSVYVADTVKQFGDTVYISKYKYIWKYQTDTLIQYKDSIVYVDKQSSEVKEVKYVPTVYKWSMGLLIGLVVLLIGYGSIKLYLKLKP